MLRYATYHASDVCASAPTRSADGAAHRRMSNAGSVRCAPCSSRKQPHIPRFHSKVESVRQTNIPVPVNPAADSMQLPQHGPQQGINPDAAASMKATLTLVRKQQQATPVVAADPLSGFFIKCRLAWNIFFPPQAAAAQPLSPKEVGRQRLSMILVADRCGLSPSSLVEMKRSTMRALQDCMDLEELQDAHLRFTMVREGGTTYSLAVPVLHAAELGEPVEAAQAGLEDEYEDPDEDDYYYDDDDPSTQEQVLETEDGSGVWITPAQASGGASSPVADGRVSPAAGGRASPTGRRSPVVDITVEVQGQAASSQQEQEQEQEQEMGSQLGALQERLEQDVLTSAGREEGDLPYTYEKFVEEVGAAEGVPVRPSSGMAVDEMGADPTGMPSQPSGASR